jgi:hypothetical protein
VPPSTHSVVPKPEVFKHKRGPDPPGASGNAPGLPAPDLEFKKALNPSLDGDALVDGVLALTRSMLKVGVRLSVCLSVCLSVLPGARSAICRPTRGAAVCRSRACWTSRSSRTCCSCCTCRSCTCWTSRPDARWSWTRRRRPSSRGT